MPVEMPSEMIVCKSSAELETMHQAGLVVWDVLNGLRERVRPGVTTLDLEEFAVSRAAEHKVRPAFKGYRGYPCVLCASVNQEVVHGIPSASRSLREGDIISLDFGVEYKGYYGDAALTVAVGKIRPEREKLLRVTRESLDRAIENVRPGKRLGDVSAAVQQWVEKDGFSVVRDFVGHGIGTKMHEEPNVPNYGEPGHGPRLEEGMVFAIEPMVTAGGPGVKVLDDHWTAVTSDGSDAAHFEHTVAVTSKGPWILTRPREAAGASW
jgi:methionyl aminopeptidase